MSSYAVYDIEPEIVDEIIAICGFCGLPILYEEPCANNLDHGGKICGECVALNNLDQFEGEA